MKTQIAADETLDYVEFRISPDDRYYAFICNGDREEKIGSSLIGQLTAHLRKDLYSDSEGSYVNFKLELPENINDANWFTKTTLTRFLEITDSRDAAKKMFAISNEMSQLEETRKFHISLHSQKMLYRNNLMTDEADNCNSNGSLQTSREENDSSDNSKNELLRAMELRLTALGDELVAAFYQAAGSSSPEQILNLENFCKHFGAADMSNVLCKLLGMNLQAIVSNPPNDKKLTTEYDSTANKMADIVQISKPIKTDQLVRYGASPAKAAEIERQSSTESEGSSSSSEEDRPSAERSRNMTRSATPRRSASPMRRIQIGRSGSRRTPAIAIKSLSYFPGRDKTFSGKDAASNDGEADQSEQTTRAAESNARRMSVQDAISLFERKQKDDTTDVSNRKTLADNPANVSKSVLRRWSSGVGETSAQCFDQSTSEQTLSVTNNALPDEAPLNNAAGVQPSTDILPCPPESEEAAEACVELETSKQSSPSPNDADIPEVHSEGAGEKLDSAEWSRKREAELNQMLMSFVQSQPSKYRSTPADDSKKLDSRTVQNKERKNQKQNQKLRGETLVKKTDKRAQPRTVPRALDKAKPEISSSTMSNVGKKQPVIKTQKEKVVKSMPLTSNSKRESPRPAVSKAPSKPSPLPATRKSWPLSTPTPRAAGILSSKIPTPAPTSGTSVPRQKSQSPASLSRLSPKLENPQQKKKDVKNTKMDANMSSKSTDENKRKVVPKSMKTAKTGIVASVESSATALAKPTLPRKVAKKSSVVPLEPKPSTIRKGSGIGPEKTSATSKKAHASPIKEPPSKSAVVAQNAVLVQGNDVDAIVSDPVIEHVEGCTVVQEVVNNADPEPESHVSTPPSADVKEISDEGSAKLDENIERATESSTEIQPEEEPIISPLAWVENGHQDSPHVSDDSTCQLAPPANLVATSAGSRVRHSLSQMLLEESSEPDIIEWGNAENPPAMVYQKDAPKGLKRLLKFARKNRGETNVGGGWSSPYASEGEDDGDETKGFGKKSSDNLLRKAALNATQHGQYGISSDGHERMLADSEPLSARSNASNSSFQSTTSATSRASRSFFSLSAFRGNKGTETKMR